MDSKRMVVPASLQGKVLNPLHLTYMGLEKIGLLAHESNYLINMNTDLEDTIIVTPHILISREHGPRTKPYHMKYQGGHENQLGLTSLPLITSTVFAL